MRGRLHLTLSSAATARAAAAVAAIVMWLCTSCLHASEPWRVGAANPGATITEYFDYNCPYCKKLAAVLTVLLAHDPHIAVVYKDWPILGEVSAYAARAALA